MLADGAGLLGEAFLIGYQQPAFRVGDGGAETRGVLRWIERHNHRARAGRRKESHAELVIVRHQQPHAGPRLDARVCDEPAERARPVKQLAKCNGTR